MFMDQTLGGNDFSVIRLGTLVIILKGYKSRILVSLLGAIKEIMVKEMLIFSFVGLWHL